MTWNIRPPLEDSSDEHLRVSTRDDSIIASFGGRGDDALALLSLGQYEIAAVEEQDDGSGPYLCIVFALGGKTTASIALPGRLTHFLNALHLALDFEDGRLDDPPELTVVSSEE